jgi:hypothetical protein
VFDYTARHAMPKDVRLYFYAGGNEHETMVPNMQHIVDTLRQRGFPEKSLRVEVNAEAQHNEKAWRAEFPRAVQWLFEKNR